MSRIRHTSPHFPKNILALAAIAMLTPQGSWALDLVRSHQRRRRQGVPVRRVPRLGQRHHHSGPQVDVGDPAPVPPTAANSALIGLIKVSNASANAFVPNTTEFDAASVTTFVNAGLMPGTAHCNPFCVAISAR